MSHSYDQPPHLVVTCPACAASCLREPLAANLMVCLGCGFHFRLSAHERLELLFDHGSFQEHDAALPLADPLAFAALGRPYAKDLERGERRTGLRESLVCGSGAIEGAPLEVAVVDFDFMGGSMGMAFGEKLSRSVERAAERAVPLVTVTASGGARIQEGIFALMQMAKVATVFRRFSRARLPHFAVIVERCYGGVLTAYVAGADIVVAEPGARIGFVGPRVVEQTLGRPAFGPAQTSEHVLARGMIDAVVPRRELRGYLARLLRFYAPKRVVKHG